MPVPTADQLNTDVGEDVVVDGKELAVRISQKTLDLVKAGEQEGQALEAQAGVSTRHGIDVSALGHAVTDIVQQLDLVAQNAGIVRR